MPLVSAPLGIAGIAPGAVLLDKYRVVREIGAGGMSLVLSAAHVSLGTKVAIKLLLPTLADLPDSPQRFEREAKAATRIEGEHVAKVLDAGTLPADGPGAGRPYMVMELLEGKDLGRLIKEGRHFSVTEAIDLVVQAADALSRAHEAGVVHRDVKPSNLFLTQRSDGSPLVKVLDFGISKVVEEAAQESLELTKTTAVMGSAMYMSPEQMRSTKTVDRRTDVWSLGISLYELLTHTHPWTAETFSELCVKVSLDPPDPLRVHRHDVSEALARAIEIAYARKLEERYQSVGQLVLALAPFASPATRKHILAIRARERASHPDLAERIPGRPPPGPSRLAWALYTTLAGALVAAAAAFALGFRPGRIEVKADAASPTASVAIDAASPDASADAAPDTASDASTDADGAADPTDGGAVAAGADAGTAKVDAGTTKPRDPCAGKPVGTPVVLPNGLRTVCGLR
ncbi:Serine/threonine-protein kinase pkn3 [Minicystis rosea]|nr:Serine/threonine-protein kinase pkn3 [Minicystis rosea]